jgi:hypothetical protein
VLEAPLAAEMPPQDVFEDVGSQVSDVDVVVNSRPAGVHPDGGSILRLEFFLYACEGVRKF